MAVLWNRHANHVQTDETSGRNGHETCELHHNVRRKSRHERQGEGGAPEEKLIYGEKINPWNMWCEELRLLQDQLPIGGSPTTHRPSIHLLRCDQEGQNLFRIVDAGESRPTAARSTYGTT